MNNKKELSYKDLKMVCNRDMFHFETTQDLESVNDGIGQERGIKALQFGLQVDVKGYNIYIEGPSGVGKTMYTKNYLDSIAPKKKVPNDWCYIYNFQNPNEPIAVSLPAGQGKEFKESMDDFEKKQNNMVNDINDSIDDLILTPNEWKKYCNYLELFRSARSDLSSKFMSVINLVINSQGSDSIDAINTKIQNINDSIANITQEINTIKNKCDDFDKRLKALEG